MPKSVTEVHETGAHTSYPRERCLLCVAEWGGRDVIRREVERLKREVWRTVPATCPECEAAPREVVKHEDDAGVKWWTLGTACTDCLTPRE